jgi:hypothetical protein
MGFISKLISSIFRIRYKPVFDEFEAIKKSDPGLKTDLENYEKSMKIIDQSVKSLCERHPNHPACKK